MHAFVDTIRAERFDFSSSGAMALPLVVARFAGLHQSRVRSLFPRKANKLFDSLSPKCCGTIVEATGSTWSSIQR
jgi:hypothetical protein